MSPGGSGRRPRVARVDVARGIHLLVRPEVTAVEREAAARGGLPK